ncbi:MAG: GTPase HflX [Candidatus Bathyarchaeota archaeon]|nr:GTPase HflX [Candidatus Bathyarchaeota archaeon]
MEKVKVEKVGNLRAVLVERRLPDEKSLLHELKILAETAGYEVVGWLSQVRYPSSKYQIGSGKVEELVKIVRETAAEKVIFENELKPIQAYNLAKKTGVEVIDKFQLILEVFNKHASTKEAKLQIELAKLKYELTRAKEKVRLAKLGEQPGFHGLGKYEADVYYEAIRRRVSSIENELQKIRVERKIKRTLRADLGFPLVSLCGYTAAGKSTLFNTLTGEKVKVSNSVFTTLSTKISATDFDGKKALLIDTVGFIDGLPLTLIEAFKSTLEETICSNLIILVVDCSEDVEEVKRKITCCLNVLREIGAIGIPIVTALNKIDVVSEARVREVMEGIAGMASNIVPISALKKINIESLEEVVANNLKNFIQLSLQLPLNSETLSLLSKIRKFSTVVNQDFHENLIFVDVKSTEYFADKILGRVESLGGRVLEVIKV